MAHLHGHNRLHRRQPGLLDDIFGNGNNPAPTKPANQFGPQPDQVRSTIVKTIVMTVSQGQGDGNGGGDSGPTSQIQQTDDGSATSTVESIDTDSAVSTEINPIETSSSSSSAPESIVVSTSQSIPSTLAIATNTPTPTNAEASAAPTATSAPSSDDSGPSVGAKAGIAIGVLAGILGIFLLAFFIYNKRRKAAEERKADDEKPENPFADPVGATSRPNNGRAPRLSLRPVTQFMPTLGRAAGPHPDRRQSRGAMIPMVQNPQSPYRGGAQGFSDRPSTAGNDRANPFGNHAAIGAIGEEDHRSRSVSPVTPVSGPGARHGGPPPSPIDGKPLPAISDAALAAGAAGAVGAAGAGLTRKTSIRKDGPAPLDLTLPPSLATVPPSPAGTEFSFHSVSPDQHPGPSSSAAAIAAAGGPPTSTVHRVQLDFKPTLEDEMELHAGQLVRLLHEYDDGWALCIRLDRSQQGVVPRTCLSTRPVKPRPPQNGGPRGPPVNPQRGPNGPHGPPGQRPRGPNGPPGPNGPHGPQGQMRGHPNGPPHGPGPNGYPREPRPESPMRPGTSRGPRPQSPAGGRRPESPAGGRMSPAPRPQSPGPRFQQGRPQSPAGMRSQSPASASRRMSPPGPSQMNPQYRPGPGPAGPPAGPVGRKPVPGQAY